MRAAELRHLCDVYRRTRHGSNVEGIQRVRDETRTGRIRRFVRYGYPYGDLKPAQRTADMQPLRKPGWLPTAIVVNNLLSGDERRGRRVKSDHLITIESDVHDRCALVIPPLSATSQTDLAPLEVIDGQHRLWAFDTGGKDEEPVPDDFELPVIAFHGLDVAWQAYLFWSINVSPKKINPSHAFDLYPLLRTQNWLEPQGELPVYREARAQELTEALYTFPQSPWKGRINMLGEKGTGTAVSQATWVRALLATFLATGRGVSRPGLFQTNLQRDSEPLEWSRFQQAAFLIAMWEDIQNEINTGTQHLWIREYRSRDQAFLSRTSMLNQDMGVRACLAVANDVFYHAAEEWELDRWFPPSIKTFELNHEQIEVSLLDLQDVPFRRRISELASGLASFDWRSFDGSNVDPNSDEGVRKRSYRGSGGYASLRHDVLEAVAEDDGEALGPVARELLMLSGET
jgi:hypothetical protein